MLESGYNSITSQVYKMGKEVLVMDKSGKSFRKEEWVRARVFWTEDQQDLLIADNQTRKYQLGDAETRKRLSLLAWGNRDRHS